MNEWNYDISNDILKNLKIKFSETHTAHKFVEFQKNHILI